MHRPPTRPAAGGVSWRRRLFHLLAGSSIPIGGLLLPRAWTVGLLSGLCALALLLEALRLTRPGVNAWAFRWLGALFKERERRQPTAATYLALAALTTFLVFPREVAALGLLFLSVGDPLAAFVGQRAPGPRLKGKSPLGTAAFLAAAAALAALVAAGTSLAFSAPLVTGAAVAALAELSPDPLDDNLKVPLLSSAVMAFLS